MKSQQNMLQSQEKRLSIDVNTKKNQIMEFSDKDLKAAIITIFSEVKENMSIMNIKIGKLCREKENRF